MKDIRIENSSPPLDRNDIHHAENKLEVIFPKNLIDFYLKHNGGYPGIGMFRNEDEECVINRIFPIENVAANADRNGLVEIYLEMTGESLLPKDAIPFGRDPGGNFFLIDPADERVWYMPMDEWHPDETPEQNWARSGRTLTHGFAAFMDALVEEDY